MTEVEKIEQLADGLKKYVNTNFELSKLELTEHVSVIGSSLIARVLMVLVALFFVFFISLTIGFYLASFLGNVLGFLIVSGFYFLLTLLLITLSKKPIEKKLRDKITWKIFKQTHR